MDARIGVWTLLSFVFGMAACGGHSNTTNPVSNIDGNWHIVGAHSIPQFPFVALAVGASGNTIYASGDVGVNCSQLSAAIGGTMYLTGQVASDGSFQMSNAASPVDTIQLTVEGKIPPTGATTWNGHFTLANAASQTGCLFNNSGDFTATAYAPFTGTYAGTVTSPSIPSPGVSITLSVVQGEPTFSAQPPLGTQDFTIPLTGSATVSGSSCYTAGSATAASGSLIRGDAFGLAFPMSDGSTLRLTGWFTDATESSLLVQFEQSSVGSCSVRAGAGTLIRQS